MTERAPDHASRTQETFGLLWRATARGQVSEHAGTHLERAAAAVDLDLDFDFDLPSAGRRFLDAGCGSGRDLAWCASRQPAVTAVGLDANDAIDVPVRAVAHLGNAHVVQGSVLAPPLRPRSFDLVYSYGVLHHTGSSSDAFRALADLVAQGGELIIYVYSDLQEEPVLRAVLRTVTALRRITTRLRPGAVLRLSRLMAPVVFVLFSLPAALLRRVPKGDGLANRLPFNHVAGPMGAVGDLYDRFSSPVEDRHSRDEVAGWFHDHGFDDIRIAAMDGARGWVGAGRLPAGDRR